MAPLSRNGRRGRWQNAIVLMTLSVCLGLPFGYQAGQAKAAREGVVTESERTEAAREVDRFSSEIAPLYWKGRYLEAVPLAERAVAISDRVLGPEHPITALSLNNLAGLYDAMGQDEQALPLYQRALAIREKVLGPEHADTVASRRNLDALYYATGRHYFMLPDSPTTLIVLFVGAVLAVGYLLHKI
jgi:tetratricopeptide (TPR) repeat protein